VRCAEFFLSSDFGEIHSRSLPMVKEKVHRERITIEVDPDVRAFLAGWAQEEGRPLSNLLRRVLSSIADERAAAREQQARAA
jgi:hypothetical protein